MWQSHYIHSAMFVIAMVPIGDFTRTTMYALNKAPDSGDVILSGHSGWLNAL